LSRTGPFNPAQPIESAGIRDAQAVFYNQGVAALYEAAVRRGEGMVAAAGPLQVTTSPHTGRSARDKFVVRDAITEPTIWWDNNNAMSRQAFAALDADMTAFAGSRELFVQDLHGGADPAYRLNVRVVTELAWHGLFIRHLLRRPELAELTRFTPDLTILNLPSFTADPLRHGSHGGTIIACDFVNGRVLIAGTRYAGETKKAVFTTLNYLLPERGVLPMHCSANAGKDQTSALFFGLSGTGKTTLSSDPSRILIGDDEHGWSEQGLFNFEGGCYAKTIRLSEEAEPQIYGTTRRFGSVLENVAIDPLTRVPDFDDATLTENGRVAYPIEFIANASTSGLAPHPKTIIMLTADAFGVLPPIARLSPAQAMYHFLSGYTAKVAGTEKGVQGTQATFSTCFGAPFMPRHPSVYGKLLRDKIARHQATCYLVNTGWSGGGYGVGSRMPIAMTRALVTAALEGRLDGAPMRRDPHFGFEMPTAVADLDPRMLDPRATWADKAAYDERASELVMMFTKNFAKFEDYVDAEIRAAAPHAKAAAE
jgi:phosphoenolpyruvate carboxykinase (ATP)